MNGFEPANIVSPSGKVRLTIDTFHDDQAPAVMRELIALAREVGRIATECLAVYEAEDADR